MNTGPSECQIETVTRLLYNLTYLLGGGGGGLGDRSVYDSQNWIGTAMLLFNLSIHVVPVNMHSTCPKMPRHSFRFCTCSFPLMLSSLHG